MARAGADPGFTYLAVLFAVALLGTGLAATGIVWHQAAQREKERELLFVGGEFREAIRRYYERSQGRKRYPHALEDLLRDQRQPGVARYLRRFYRDPMTGGAEWGLIRAADGGIMGVHSLSTAAPRKVAGFRAADRWFAGAESYADWRFIFLPEG